MTKQFTPDLKLKAEVEEDNEYAKYENIFY